MDLHISPVHTAGETMTPGRRLGEVRARTESLCVPLEIEDYVIQVSDSVSPPKWHLAHTTWFFETFLLERFEADFVPHHPAFRVLFNSYYNSIGDKHARPQRGLLTRPSLADVLDYRQQVDARLRRLLETPSVAIADLIALGLQHEQQHQELILTDAKHLLFMNPLYPAYACDGYAAPINQAPPSWRQFDAGVVNIGYGGDGFCFDHELPRHRQFVEHFSIAATLVTNRDYLAFIGDGGYRKDGSGFRSSFSRSRCTGRFPMTNGMSSHCKACSRWCNSSR
jgi:ergothioneine biosynthesis protein EgtB